MKARHILLSGLSATSLMTLFSIIASRVTKENFSEPTLLAHLEKDYLPKSIKPSSLIAGYGTHYTIGIAWAVAYQCLFANLKVKPSLSNGLILGGISGIIGVVIWKYMFKKHPNPPTTDYRNFYLQLFVAHLIYGSTATAYFKTNAKDDLK